MCQVGHASVKAIHLEYTNVTDTTSPAFITALNILWSKMSHKVGHPNVIDSKYRHIHYIPQNMHTVCCALLCGDYIIIDDELM